VLIFFGISYFFLIKNQANNSTAMFSLKNLTPWRHSNPDLTVPQVDAMTTTTGQKSKLHWTWVNGAQGSKSKQKSKRG
jgi:hypothetical protein